MLRIVHLSDIHFNSSFLENLNIVEALKNDLIKYNTSEKKIDLIIISGDLIDKAGESFDKDIVLAFMEFEDKFIKPIINHLSLDKNKVFLCPGNHDMKVSNDQEKDEQWLFTKLQTTKVVNNIISNNNTNESKRTIPFFEFIKSFYSQKMDDEIAELSPYELTFNILKDGKKIGITCFNSAWRCYSSNNEENYYDKGKLILGEYQITRSKRIINDCDIKIAVMHHNFEWFKEFDKRDIEKKIFNEYNMLFQGHNHRADCEQKNKSNSSIYISTAPMNWSGNINTDSVTYSNGYAIIDYNYNTIIAHHRRYSSNKCKYVSNNDFGDDEGIDRFDVPSSIVIQKNKKLLDFQTKLENSYFNEIDHNVLTSIIETSAPTRFDDIFVDPILIKKGKIGVEGETEDVDYSIDDLLTTEENLIINGSRESGKTLLLNKLLKITINNINKIIPIYIDFQTIGSKKIENIVCSFTGFNKLEIFNILNEHSVLFLIDNISLNKNNEKNISKLETFLNLCTSKKVIATKYQKIEGIDPDALDYTGIFSDFKHLNIKAFNSKQIKQLIRKWFVNSDTFNNDNHFKKIFDILIKFNIPRTPLTISMFLWVIEQQEDFKPINHATMLENFIEKTFEKQSETIAYSKDFDYRNKERLLASIAYKMYLKENDNYYFSYDELLKYICEYISQRRFSFKSDEILNEFIRRGILSETHNNGSVNIQFRFESFFKYFLMKQMDFDDTFKKYVLQDENFYMFTDEIDYYTAIKRDQVDILIMVVNNMSEIYSNLIKEIESNDYSFDFAFENSYSLTKNSDEKDINSLIKQEKPTEDQMDIIHDKILDSSITHKGIQKKNHKINHYEKMAEIMLLSSKLLKNTEEIADAGLKDKCLEEIIKCSMAYAVLYKIYIEKKIIEKEINNEEIDEKSKIINTLLPLLHQVLLYSCMGTEKLSLVIKDKITNDYSKTKISDFEKFITVFLYSDIKGKDYFVYIHKFIEEMRCNYIYDMALFKIITYYYFRSNNRDSNLQYERLIADLIISSKKRNKSDKGKIMQEYRDKRLIRRNTGELV